MEKRGIFIYCWLFFGNALFLADRKVRNALPAEWYQSRNPIGIDIMFCKIFFVEHHHHPEITSRRMSRYKNRGGISSVFSDITKNPGDRRRGIFDIDRSLDLRMQ